MASVDAPDALLGIVGDITILPVEGIVNAANPSLLGGGGVDGAIHRAAGPALAEAARRHAPLAPGEAIATAAFGLPPPIRAVIHTVGPIWHGGRSGEEVLLRRAYLRSYQEACRLGLASVAFPAISAGAYGYPADEAARVAVETLREQVARAISMAGAGTGAELGGGAEVASGVEVGSEPAAAREADAVPAAGGNPLSVAPPPRVVLVAFQPAMAAHYEALGVALVPGVRALADRLRQPAPPPQGPGCSRAAR